MAWLNWDLKSLTMISGVWSFCELFCFALFFFFFFSLTSVISGTELVLHTEKGFFPPNNFKNNIALYSFRTEQVHVALYMTAIASLSNLVRKPIMKVLYFLKQFYV